ncbi:hypothetical protein C8F01DRAFT_1021303 [Mycena amicta]|nr:hypothetical protein C8F01DRAFT_1021303 [Mycena amicta]
MTASANDHTVFSPIRLPCGRELRNRLVKAALYEHLATLYGGPPNRLHLSLYATWAAYDWGMIITGNVQVSSTHLSLARDLVLPDLPMSNEKLGPFRALADAIHGHREHKPLALMQLSHAGRQSPNLLGGRIPFASPMGPSRVRVGASSEGVSAVLHRIMFQTPKCMSLDDIDEVVRAFVSGAKVAAETGFDGVELHAAHGYLLAQFMSPKSNKRTDEYSPHSLRLLSRVVHEIRLVVPSDFVLGVKMNSADYTDAAGPDPLQHVRAIASWGLVDFIEISGGDYEKPDFLTEDSAQLEQSKTSRQALFADFSHRATESLSSAPPASRPLILLTGGLSTPAHLTTALSSGHAHLLGLGRAAALCPELPQRLLDGDVDSTLPFSHQPSLRLGDIRWLGQLFDRLPRIKLIGAGATMAWYTVILRRVAIGHTALADGARRRRSSPDYHNIGALGGIVWMWLWFEPELDVLRRSLTSRLYLLIFVVAVAAASVLMAR